MNDNDSQKLKKYEILPKTKETPTLSSDIRRYQIEFLCWNVLYSLHAHMSNLTSLTRFQFNSWHHHEFWKI